MDNRNVYQTARRAAGLTQEKAAELMGVPDRSLRAYETGERVPPNDVVELMCDCYNAQHLAYQHLKESNSLMHRVVPALEPRDLREAVLRIYNRLRRFDKAKDLERLMDIAEDGRIDDQERQEYDAILNDINELIQSGLELKMYCGEEDTHE